MYNEKQKNIAKMNNYVNVIKKKKIFFLFFYESLGVNLGADNFDFLICFVLLSMTT